ncbi:MAG: DUF5050 domain-containing protein [Bacteroidota bacterium]
MRNVFLLLFICGQYFAAAQQIITVGTPAVSLSNVDIETKERKILTVGTGSNDLVAFNHLTQNLYVQQRGGVARQLLGMGPNGGCVDFDLIGLQDVSGTDWAHDFANEIIYSIAGQNLFKLEYKGDVPEVLIGGLDEGVGIAVDVEEGYVYWTELNLNTVNRAKLDGSGREELIRAPSGLSQFVGIALDAVNKKVYYVDKGQGKIHRMDYDGSNPEEIVSDLNDPTRIGLYAPDNKIYWISEDDEIIQQADLDGSNVSNLIDTEISMPYVLYVDPTNGDLYWAGNGFNLAKVERVQPRSGERKVLLFNLEDGFQNLSHDPINERVFLSDPNFAGGRMVSMNYDGSSPEIIGSERINGGRPYGVADGFNGYFYYVGGPGIRRINLDSKVEEDFMSMQRPVNQLEIDVESGRLYWSEANGSMGYIDLASKQSTTITSTEFVQTFALDLTNKKIYYAHGDDEQIKRMDLDGTNVEPLVSGIAKQIELDVPNDRLYWLIGPVGFDIFYTDLNGFFRTKLEGVSPSEFAILGASGSRIMLNTIAVNGNNQSASLTWTLEDDFLSGLQDGEVFSVQRQNASTLWDELGTIAFASGQGSYDFTDPQPQEGVNRYRLRYLSPDGDVQFSPVQSLDISTSTEDLSQLEAAQLDLRQGPASLQLRAERGVVDIYSVEGKLLRSFQMADPILEIATTGWERGTYVLRHRSEDGQEGAKLFTIVQ